MPLGTAASVPVVPLAPHETKAFIKFPGASTGVITSGSPRFSWSAKLFSTYKNPFFQHAQAQLFMSRAGSKQPPWE
jgi:hypothetical protein